MVELRCSPVKSVGGGWKRTSQDTKKAVGCASSVAQGRDLRWKCARGGHASRW